MTAALRHSAVRALCAVLIAITCVYHVLNAAHFAGVGNDLAQDYAAALAFSRDQAPYGESIGQIGFEISGDPHRRGIRNFHPPVMTLLSYPLTLFTFRDAVRIWTILCLILYCGIIRIALRELKYPRELLLPLLAVFLLWYPLVAHVALGQFSIPLSYLIVRAWASFRHQRWDRCAAWIGAATLVKLYPLFLFAAPAAARRWRAVGVGAIIVAGGFAVSAGVMGWEAWRTYMYEIAPSNVQLWSIYPINQSLHGVLIALAAQNYYVAPLLGQAGLAPLVPLICAAAGLLLCGVLYHWGRRLASTGASRGDLDRLFLGAISGMLLLSPITWEHYFPALIPLILASAGIRPLWILCVVLLALPDIEIVRWLVPPQGIPGGVAPAAYFFLIKAPFWGLVLSLGLAAQLGGAAERRGDAT